MKATLEYELPEEANEFILASRANDWALVAWDMDQRLRSWLKYGHDSHKFEDIDDALEKTRRFLHSLLAERNLSLEMIL